VYRPSYRRGTSPSSLATQVHRVSHLDDVRVTCQPAQGSAALPTRRPPSDEGSRQMTDNGCVLRSLLLAPPGAGKGTQGKRIAALYGVQHISTGDLLREEIAAHTHTGREAETFMAAGELVPDDLVMILVLERLATLSEPVGFVLDGYPRTIAQAREAYAWGNELALTFQVVIVLQVPELVLLERVVHRAEKIGRVDDTTDTFRHRLQIYAATSEPLFDFYRRRGILVEVDGTGTVDEVTDRIRFQIRRLGFR